jgi:hypothetical protein
VERDEHPQMARQAGQRRERYVLIRSPLTTTPFTESGHETVTTLRTKLPPSADGQPRPSTTSTSSTCRSEHPSATKDVDVVGDDRLVPEELVSLARR